LARSASEITSEYIQNFVSKSIDNGVEFVATEKESHQVIGEIHCYNSGLKVFSHVYGDLTIAVDPLYQGKGIGRKLFTGLLNEVKKNRRDILRVELLARESNKFALKFYESLGFKPEGKLENRIQSVGGGYEADIFMAWHR
jgi:ribosomal protein S18 acetylase RimI-like enzyme